MVRKRKNINRSVCKVFREEKSLHLGVTLSGPLALTPIRISNKSWNPPSTQVAFVWERFTTDRVFSICPPSTSSSISTLVILLNSPNYIFTRAVSLPAFLKFLLQSHIKFVYDMTIIRTEQNNQFQIPKFYSNNFNSN